MNLPTGVLIALTMACVSVAQTMPRAGDIYREYSTDLRSGNSWRVTDPDAAHPGAQDFLPNPVLSMQIDDLDGAVRAELLIDRWGGHPGTSEKRVRFNGNDWLDLPELATTPEDHDPRAYMYEDNPVIDVPLAHLHEGENTFEGTCGDQVVHSFGWGQWGWYGAVLRVYFDADKPHATGRILRDDGTALGEGPIIEVETSGDVDRVDVFAFYEGYDEDGDGEYVGWHGEIRRTELHGHVGTATEAPFRVTWDT
ncbi:MAG TPA: hypothetical protein QGH10_12190, partial [Armatimonadota bacterium]|nr:hypothetical protein [Armatimonadota bacterium]